ncbi:hypothetical protein [Staphylococcus phage SpP]
MVKIYNTFYDLDVVKRTKDLIDLPQGMIVKKFNILYGKDISDLAEGSVVMVTDIKLKTLGFFRKNKNENSFKITSGGIDQEVVFMDVTSHTGLDFDTEEYFKEDKDIKFQGVLGSDNIKDGVKDVVDAVNKPSHYTFSDKFEIIDVVEEVTKQYPPHLAFAIGNAIKYIARSQHKNGKQDISKSIWYLQRVLDKWDDKDEK